MDEKTKKTEIGKMLVLMSEAFGAQMSKPLVALWTRELLPFEVEEAQRGIAELIRERRFSGLPPLGEVLARIKGVKEDLLLVGAEEQWAVIVRRITSGSWKRGVLNREGRVVFVDTRQMLDTTTLSVLSAWGGPAYLDTWREVELAHRRREFMESYARRLRVAQVAPRSLEWQKRLELLERECRERQAIAAPASEEDQARVMMAPPAEIVEPGANQEDN